MPSRAQEIAEIYLRSAEVSLQNFDIVKYKKYHDFFRGLDYFEESFALYLVIGRIQWRHRLKSPVSVLQQGIEIAHRAATVAREMRPGDYAKSMFQFGSAAVLSYLVESTIDPAFADLTPQVAEWRSLRDWASRHAPDAGIVSALNTGHEPAAWEEMLAGISLRPQKSDCDDFHFLIF